MSHDPARARRAGTCTSIIRPPVASFILTRVYTLSKMVSIRKQREGTTVDIEAHPAMTAADPWPKGKTLGQMTPAERESVIRHAARKVEDELRRNADAISKILDEFDQEARP
jgi:hypothetical protein